MSHNLPSFNSTTLEDINAQLNTLCENKRISALLRYRQLYLRSSRTKKVHETGIDTEAQSRVRPAAYALQGLHRSAKAVIAQRPVRNPVEPSIPHEPRAFQISTAGAPILMQLLRGSEQKTSTHLPPCPPPSPSAAPGRPCTPPRSKMNQGLCTGAETLP